MNKKEKAYIESLAGDINRKMPDYDGDGYPDIFDCDPFDPTKDGLIGESWARMTGAVTRAQQAARRVYTPAAARARQTAAQATARVRQVAAAAAERVTAHRRAGVERRVAIRERIKREPPKQRVDIVKAYKETEKEVSKRIPTLQAIEQYGAEFGERPAVSRAYQEIGERVLALPEPIKAFGVETFKFTRGGYKEFQQYPVTTAAKVAAFAVAGPAIRGVGLAATTGRVALAARAPTVARIPGVGPAMVTAAQRAAWLGEKAIPYAMPAMGVLWAGSVGQRIYKTPAELRAEEAGRIFMAEVVPMAGGAAVAQEAAMFRQLGIPKWKPPSIKKVKEWKPPAVAKLPPSIRPHGVGRPPVIEPIAIPPQPGIPRKIQLRNMLIELEGKPPRGSARFGTKAEKAAWVKYNQKITSIKGRIKKIEAKEASKAIKAREAQAKEAKEWKAAEAAFAETVGAPKPIGVTVRKVTMEPPVRKPRAKTLEDEWKAAEASYKEQFEAPTPVAAVVKKPTKPKDVFEEAKKAAGERVKKRLVEEKKLKEQFGDAPSGAPGRPGVGQQLLLRQEVKAKLEIKPKVKMEKKLVQEQKQAAKAKVKQEQELAQKRRQRLVVAGEQMTKTMQAAETQRQKQLAEMVTPLALQLPKVVQLPKIAHMPAVAQVPRIAHMPAVTHVPRVDQAQKYRVPPPPQILKVPPPPPPVTRRPPPPPPKITEPPPPPPFIPFMMDDGIGGAAAVRAKRKRAWKQKHELITLSDFLGYKPINQKV